MHAQVALYVCAQVAIYVCAEAAMLWTQARNVVCTRRVQCSVCRLQMPACRLHAYLAGSRCGEKRPRHHIFEVGL